MLSDLAVEDAGIPLFEPTYDVAMDPFVAKELYKMLRTMPLDPDATILSARVVSMFCCGFSRLCLLIGSKNSLCPPNSDRIGYLMNRTRKKTNDADLAVVEGDTLLALDSSAALESHEVSVDFHSREVACRNILWNTRLVTSTSWSTTR